MDENSRLKRQISNNKNQENYIMVLLGYVAQMSAVVHEPLMIYITTLFSV